MKRALLIVVVVMVFFVLILPSQIFAAEKNRNFSQAELDTLSPRQRAELIQMAEEVIIRKDAVKQAEMREYEETAINMAVKIALGTADKPAQPQKGWEIIKNSAAVSGQKKLELFLLLKSVFSEVTP